MPSGKTERPALSPSQKNFVKRTGLACGRSAISRPQVACASRRAKILETIALPRDAIGALAVDHHRVAMRAATLGLVAAVRVIVDGFVAIVIQAVADLVDAVFIILRGTD